MRKSLNNNNLHRFRNLLSDTELRTKVGTEAVTANMSAREPIVNKHLETIFSVSTLVYQLLYFCTV